MQSGVIFFASSSYFSADDSVGRIARKLWWTNQACSPVDIILPWFSMPIYHMGDEQYARWWQQFRDVVPPHQHDHHHCIKYFAVDLVGIKT
jgi:hypothetical protein